LTGRYPVHHGIYGALKTDSRYGLPLNERTIAQGLHTAGYTTAICGKWHMGEFEPEYRPMHRGFDHQYGLWYGQLDYFTHMRGGRVDWYRDDKPCDDQGYTTQLIGREAVRIIDEQPKDKPLFLYVPFNAVHGPFQVPDSYREPYRQLPRQRQILAGMLSVVDEEVGRIVGAIHAKQMDENTLIIFSSDNGGVGPGTITMNTPLRAGKGTIYEGGVRSGAFAVWPGKVPAGKRIAQPVHIIDWYPTLLKLTGADLAQPLPVDGVDIWPLIARGVAPDRDALLLVGTQPRRTAIRMGDWKLLLGASERDEEDEVEGEASAAQPSGNVTLYNLADDISEKHDLAAAQPRRVTAMRARLDELMKDAVKPLGATTPRRK
jgi:arylsulfatase A-like enzyme